MNLWEPDIANMNFKSAEHCACEFYESWALRTRILWELSITNVNLWELSFANENFMRAEQMLWVLWMWICESWSLRIWIWRALSIVNVNFMKAELCECGFDESWVLRMWIFWELSIANAIFMRADLCEYEFWELLILVHPRTRISSTSLGLTIQIFWNDREP